MIRDSMWMLTGDCVEACTSPPVCPYYFGSSAPTDLHEGKDQCEGAFTLSVKRGHYLDTDLRGLNVGIAFNTPVGGSGSTEPWIAILYIDTSADQAQTKALQNIFQTSWQRVGQLLATKRTLISFIRTPVGSSRTPGYRHSIEWKGFYKMKAEPLITKEGCPRYISGLTNGIIFIGKSTKNDFHDNDLPRGHWSRPEMSSTYFEFNMDKSRLDWVP